MRTSVPRPSLNALRAFEATVRLGSMTAAAAELFVTHGAVSRHIRALEDQLGVLLLDRSGQATAPTPDGVRLAEGLASAFRLIQASVEQLKPAPLTLSCSASIMMYWLLPRVGSFLQKHPDVDLQFNVNYGSVDFVWDNVSVAIRVSSVKPPEDAHVRDLMVEWIGPVCSAEYKQSAGLDNLDALARARHLATKTRLEAWEDWVAASGYAGKRIAISERFEHFFLLIQAAICGLGVAVVPRILVLDDLRSGKLVAPFGFVASRRKLQLWIAPHLDGRSDVEALARWLTTEMKATETSGPALSGREPPPPARAKAR
jgi:DNA-binding transcriptional LysR family regulator